MCILKSGHKPQNFSTPFVSLLLISIENCVIHLAQNHPCLLFTDIVFYKQIFNYFLVFSKNYIKRFEWNSHQLGMLVLIF